jgi:hypothetical protein
VVGRLGAGSTPADVAQSSNMLGKRVQFVPQSREIDCSRD